MANIFANKGMSGVQDYISIQLKTTFLSSILSYSCDSEESLLNLTGFCLSVQRRAGEEREAIKC